VSDAREGADRKGGHGTAPTAGWTLPRLLYWPWVWIVWVPYFVLGTVFWGALALIIAFFSDRASFHCGTAWAWLACRLNFTRVRVVGREKVARDTAYVIMCNHQSQFDILAFYGHWGWQYRWVMKYELLKIPFLGWATYKQGNIFIDRRNRELAIASLKKAQPIFDRGISVLIFPEGTRNYDGHMLPFKKGGFVMAMDAGLPILPVSIAGTERILPNGTVQLLPGAARVTIHDPVETAGLGPDDRDALMESVRETIGSAL
jgi:1-acyl-sn-glycerol-3-phosphate acyltransferase